MLPAGGELPPVQLPVVDALARLNRAGRGSRVEIHPLNQSGVRPSHQRVVEFRTLNVRRWEALVAAWSTGDDRALDDAWIEQIVDLGSQWGQYEHGTNIGFAARCPRAFPCRLPHSGSEWLAQYAP